MSESDATQLALALGLHQAPEPEEVRVPSLFETLEVLPMGWLLALAQDNHSLTTYKELPRWIHELPSYKTIKPVFIHWAAGHGMKALFEGDLSHASLTGRAARQGGVVPAFLGFTANLANPGTHDVCDAGVFIVPGTMTVSVRVETPWEDRRRLMKEWGTSSAEAFEAALPEPLASSYRDHGRFVETRYTAHSHPHHTFEGQITWLMDNAEGFVKRFELDVGQAQHRAWQAKRWTP